MPRFVAFTFEVDAKLVKSLAFARLPRQWRTSRGLLATQQLGDDWLESGRALALAVPSAVVPEESNYLLNPEHPPFARLEFGQSIPFLLDPGLID